MARFLFVVPSSPVAGREKEYNDWYEHTHLDEVVKVPGFVSAERFELFGDPFTGDPPRHKYVAHYEIEADDVEDALNALRERVPSMVISEAFDADTATGAIFRPTGRKHVSNSLQTK